jgi:hypothetical protein
MADFARLACAAAPAFGWSEADMLAAIEGNRAAAVASVIESDPVAEAVVEYARRVGHWTGTAGDLLVNIGPEVADEVKRERTWPRTGPQFAIALKRAAPALRRLGLDVQFGDREPGTGRRLIRLDFRTIGESLSQLSRPSQNSGNSNA